MKCDVCGATTNVNLGTSKEILCEKCAFNSENAQTDKKSAIKLDHDIEDIISRESMEKFYSLMPIFLYILAVIALISGVIMYFSLLPGDPGVGKRWKTIAYMPSITWMIAGIIEFALFIAIGQILSYLRTIAINTSKDS